MKKIILAVFLIGLLAQVSAIDINDTESLDYWSDNSLDFRVEPDGTIRGKGDLDMAGNDISQINEIRNVDYLELDGDIDDPGQNGIIYDRSTGEFTGAYIPWQDANDLNSGGTINDFSNANDLDGGGTINDFSAGDDLDSNGDVVADHINLNNIESVGDGQLGRDNSIGYLGNWGGNGNAVLWDAYNVQEGNAISVTGGTGNEDNPQIAVNEGAISHDNIGGVSYNDHHSLGDDLSWDGSNNPRLDSNIDVNTIDISPNSDFMRLTPGSKGTYTLRYDTDDFRFYNGGSGGAGSAMWIRHGGEIDIAAGPLDLNGANINSIGGLQGCGSNQFVNGNGNCVTDDNTDGDTSSSNEIQDLEDVRSQDNTVQGTINLGSNGDVDSVNNLNVGTINSNNGDSDILFHQGFTVDGDDGGDGGVTLETGNLEMGGNSINNIGGLQDCNANEFVDGTGSCNVDTTIPDDQNLEDVRTQGNNFYGTVDHSGYDIASVGNLNVRSIDSNKGSDPVDMDQGMDMDGSSIIDDSDNEVNVNDNLKVTGNVTSNTLKSNGVLTIQSDANDDWGLDDIEFEHGSERIMQVTTGGLFMESKLDMNGNAIVSNGNVTVDDSLKVTGNLWTDGADLAEIYSTPQNLENAELVKINTKKDDSVVRTEKEFDSVTGVVSTDPSHVMNQNETGEPIALEGKVPVKISDENGEIERGDRIVPSSKSGVAMKCEIIDPMEQKNKSLRKIMSQNEDCRSSTVGKALEEPLNGKVLVKLS